MTPPEPIPTNREAMFSVRIDRVQLERAIRQAEGYLELGLVEQALCVLQRRGKLVHGSGRGCYLMGESLREQARYDEAIIPLERSAQLMPDDIHIWLALGWCYKRVGRLSRAIEALENALDINPTEAILHYNLACYWSLAHNRMMALSYLSYAIDMDSNFRDLVHDEPDFAPLRNDTAFKLLTGVIV